MTTQPKSKLIPFDMAEHLDSPEAIAEYITQVLADGDTAELLRALGNVAKAHGMSQIAADTGLGRESLYKALRGDAQPRLETVTRVLRAVGLQLAVKSIAA